MCTEKHSIYRNTLAYTCTYITHTHFYAEQQKHAHACVLLPKIFISFGGYSTLATQPYLRKACYLTKQSLLSHSKGTMNTLGPANERCVVDKVWPYWTQSTTKREHITASCWSACRAHRDHCIVTQEKGGANIYNCSILLCLISHSPTKMTDDWKNAASAHSVCLLVNFSFSFCLTIILPACHIMKLLQNKVRDKKERKKKQFCFFDVKRFRTLAILQQVLIITTVLAALKNTQSYK